MWEIDKTFNMEYGHRVHNQQLDAEYSVDTCCVCRHNHGHSGLVRIFLTGDTLTRGMVVDFKMLNWVKVFIDDIIDHKMILDVVDPNLDLITAGNLSVDTSSFITIQGDNLPLEHLSVPGTEHSVGTRIDTTSLETGDLQDFYDSFVFVNFVPTSENLAKWLYDAVDSKMSKINVKVSKIEWNETAKSRAVYSGN